MNDIPNTQNSERQIQKLAAQRQLYATAKKVFGWQVVISAPIAVALAFSVIMYPELKPFVALWGILVTILDVAWLTPWQKRLRNTAARIQESFDCDVLGLPWNELKAGKHPDPELVREQADKYKKLASSMPPILDWYAKDVECLPLHVARLVCQRSNCWWDSKQRRRYAVTVIACVVVIFVVVLFLAMGGGFILEDFVLKVAAPLSPALLLGYRQFAEQMETASRLDKLKEHAERLWADALGGKPESDLTVRARGLQDEILGNRIRSPLVFDALFKRLRRGYEIQMNHGAAEFITEAKKKLRLP
jgi:hypothetical protein